MNLTPILSLIRKHESRSNYDVVWGGIRAADRPKTPVTKLSIGQVLAWQDAIDSRYMSEAAGAYQILEDTLRKVYLQAGLRLTDPFNEANQDRLAIQLMKGRGLDSYVAGLITAEQFGLALAKEWASLPVPFDVKRGQKVVKRGQSYYAGDGLNKALTPVEPFLDAIRAIKTPAPKPVSQPAPAAPRRSFADSWRIFWNTLLGRPTT